MSENGYPEPNSKAFNKLNTKLNKPARRRPTQKKSTEIDWVPTLFLSLTPVLALASAIWFFMAGEAFSWWYVVLFGFFYTATAMSITGGYHRLYSHKAYQANKFVQIMYALFGAAAFQNSILKWATDHRIHHRFVDTQDDPYSINKGFWYAHFGWMCHKDERHPHYENYRRDLLRDPIVMWQDKYYLWIALAMCYGLPTVLGYVLAGSWLGGFVWGGAVRLVAVHHSTFFINSLAHWWGKQTYTDENTARDNFVAAVLTFGEGYHNFHHLFANDYRNGIRWYHWDPTKWLILLKAKLGMAYNLRQTPEDQILHAKLMMDQKQLIQRVPADHHQKFEKSLEELRIKLLTAQRRLQDLKEEYRRIKAVRTEGYKQKLEAIRKEWEHARQEVLRAYEEWKLFLSQPTLATT